MKDKRWLTPQAFREVLAVETRAQDQQTVARRLGISPQYLCDVLKGRREPGGKLLKAFGYRRVVVYEETP